MELLQEFRDFLPARYPALFEKTEVGIDNLVTGESFNIDQMHLKEHAIDPMEIAAKLVQDDLAIMIEGEDGQYYLKHMHFTGWYFSCLYMRLIWRI